MHCGQNTSRSSAKPSEARPCRAKRGHRRRRPAPEAPPSLARVSNKSTDATQLAATEHVAYIQLSVGGKACSARTGYNETPNGFATFDIGYNEKALVLQRLPYITITNAKLLQRFAYNTMQKQCFFCVNEKALVLSVWHTIHRKY